MANPPPHDLSEGGEESAPGDLTDFRRVTSALLKVPKQELAEAEAKEKAARHRDGPPGSPTAADADGS
jgi:hypothetical protein